MPTKTGIDAQIGYVAESTYGTGVTVTRFLPLVSESLKKEIEMVESDGIIAGAQILDSQQWAQGNVTVGGDVAHKFPVQSAGLLLRATFGTVTTTGTAAPYSHTFWPVPPDVSLTTQVGRPAGYGSVIPYTYTGCKVAAAEFAAEAGQFVTWGMTLAAQEETAGTALAAASYATSVARSWHANTGTLKIDGTLVPVKAFSFSVENSLDTDRRFLGSGTISEPLRNELVAITGELSCEWGNPTAMGTLNYHRFIGGTESSLVFTMVSGTLEGTITANVRYDGATPNVEGRGIVQHSIPWKAVRSSTDASAFTVVLKNNDSTA